MMVYLDDSHDSITATASHLFLMTLFVQVAATRLVQGSEDP